MSSKFKKVILSLFVPAILLAIVACPGLIIERISITFGPGGAIVSATGTFSCNSPTGEVLIYRWFFGDGSSADGQTVTHAYQTAGDFLVECHIVTIDSVIIFTETLTISSRLTHIYWSNRLDDTIGRAKIDGTDVNNSFIDLSSLTIDMGDLAVNNTHIFWAEIDNRFVGRANLDGSNIVEDLFDGSTEPSGVALNETFIYVADEDIIARANIDGSSPDLSFISPSRDAKGIAVNDSFIYFASRDFDAILRHALDGSGVTTNFIDVSNNPEGVAINDTFIYWANLDLDTIGRANLDGTGVDNSFIDLSFTDITLQYIEIDDTYIYWVDSEEDRIGRAMLDGTGIETDFIATGDTPVGIAIGPGQ